MMGQWMVRIGESMLKSRPVRKQFTKVLIQTLTAQCRLRGATIVVRAEGGLLFVSGENDEQIVDALKHTFGVNAVDPYIEMDADPDMVAKAALERNPKPSGTFAVQCRRHGEKGKWTSQSFASTVGAKVLERVDLKVNLGNPDWAIRVALFPDKVHLLGTRFMGPGGLPSGVQGLVLANLESDEDILSAWLMMHRGCRIKPAKGSVESLQQWDPALASEKYANQLVTGPGGRHDAEPWGIVAHHLPDAPTTVDAEENVRTPLVHLEPLVGME
tara:strand:- start:131 stop:946 length:816 start_codon:yes stop_codon:yes gene_type:complete